MFQVLMLVAIPVAIGSAKLAEFIVLSLTAGIVFKDISEAKKNTGRIR